MKKFWRTRGEAYARIQNYPAALADLNAWVSRNINNYDPAAHNVTTAKASAFYGTPADVALIETALDFKRITYMQEGIRCLDNIRLVMPILRYAGSDYSTVIDSIATGDTVRGCQFPLHATTTCIRLNPE